MYLQTTLNLSIGYRNIAGKHDKSHGCKINTQIKLKNNIEILSVTSRRNSRISKTSLVWKVISFHIFAQTTLLNAPWVEHLSYSQIQTSLRGF